MKRKMKCTIKLIALMLIFTSIGGCSVNQKAHTKQAQTATSSSTKEDTEVLKQRQVDFLKKYESEITNYIKSNSGSFTESGFNIRLKVYGANDKELNGYSFFIVPKPNVENPTSIDSISGSNFP